MLGGIHKYLFIVVLFLTQLNYKCRAENELTSVTLPKLQTASEHVAECLNPKDVNGTCDWMKFKTMGLGNVEVDIFESQTLGFEGNACLEFWYLTQVATNGSKFHVVLKSHLGVNEIWSSIAVSRDGWKQVSVMMNISEPASKVVFESVQPMSVDVSSLKQIIITQGSCEKPCDSDAELWPENDTRCICPDGQFFCFPSECPKDQSCGAPTQSSTEISTKGVCTIHGHTDCSTFDGDLFRVVGSCTYVLAKTCSPTETLPKFSVELVKEQSNSSLPAIQQITVNLGKLRITMIKGQTKQIVVNGVWKKLPLGLSNSTISIKGNPISTILETISGFSVSYDSAGAVHVTLPSSYSNKVCGMCGNFNRVRGDDFLMPDGTKGENVTGWIESWQIGKTSCETIPVPYHCDVTEEAQYSSELYCGSLLSETGPFAECRSVLKAESYFRACMVGMCILHGDLKALCETFQRYEEICKEAGVTVPAWRNSKLCPLQCGENSHYNACANGCPEVCSSLDMRGSCTSCTERCVCDPGFKLSGEKCVLQENCGCWHEGKHYEKGQTFMAEDCAKQCQCLGNNSIACSAMKCADNELCKESNGAKGCFAFNPATCTVYGDPHYITFDKLAYDFQGGCSYTLTKTCGSDSPVQFSVTGYNMHPPLGNLTRSKLDAVALQILDLHIILNQSGEVSVNDGNVRLPHFINGTFGLVLIHIKYDYLFLETTFGLKMAIDGRNRLFLQVDDHYKHELCGLCGTYSGYQDDDFLMPGGEYAAGPFEFGDSWRIHNNYQCISHPNDPRPCGTDETEANEACSVVFSNDFSACHEKIHPSIYLSSCMYDYCATNGDQYTLCESLKSYAAACQFVGVQLGSWEIGTVCAGPQTTVIPTTSGITSQTTNQTSCPLDCNFDQNLCGWEQMIQDSFDWTRHSGPTPSNQTGPNQDHTSGDGFYIHLEGDAVTHGDSARLLSPTCHYDGPLCLRFWYSLYGSAISMALNIYLLKDNSATKIWSMRNNRGPDWHSGNVDLTVSSPFQIIIEGIRGSTALSDVALDDLTINTGSCLDASRNLILSTALPVTVTEILPSHQDCNLDCSFDGNLCAWNQMVTDAFDWTWNRGSTPTDLTGPSADHTGGGHYVYIESNNVTHGDTARLISTECSSTGPQCLKFWYHMYGSADTMGLNVYLIQNRVTDAIWWKRNDQGNVWHLAQVDFETAGPFQMMIEGRRGSNEQSDVAVDDIKFNKGHCTDNETVTAIPVTPSQNTVTSQSVPVPTTAGPTQPVVNVGTNQPTTIRPTTETTTRTAIENVTPTSKMNPVCPLDCDFERDLCQWVQLLTDVFDWERKSGSTPSNITGPSSDHTTGSGHYLYIEANRASLGDTARLISPECLDHGPLCLQFWYHMYGSADTMGLHVYLLQDKKADVVWRKSNDQGNIWHEAQVDLKTSGKFQIIIEGRRGSNDQSDVAIDDLSLHYGACKGGVEPTQSISTGPITGNCGVLTSTSQPLPSNATGPTGTAVPPPQPSASSTEPPSTATPQLSSKEATWPPSTDAPLPQSTVATAAPPSTAAPLLPFTAATAAPPSTAAPLPPFTAATAAPPSTAAPLPQSTAAPPSTAAPLPQSTAAPPSTAAPLPQSTAAPPSTAAPLPQSTAAPPSTAAPLPQSTAAPPSTAAPLPQSTAAPPSTAAPLPQSTAAPPSTAAPLPQSTAATVAPPTPSCAKNSHFTTCIPACNPTCTDLNGPPHCKKDDGCTPGCVCDDGFVQKGRVCVPIQQCGCVDRNGTRHEFNELWYSKHCTQKCECEKDDGIGKIKCESDKCDDDSVCLQNDGGFYCQSTGFSECVIKGDHKYKTFDEMKHDFKGEHSYVLVRTKNLPSNIPDVYIEVINTCTIDDSKQSDSEEDDSDQVDDSSEEQQKLGLQEIKMKVYNHTVEFKKDRKLIVDGNVAKVPAAPTEGLNIAMQGSLIRLKSDFGLSVDFNGHCKTEIILPYIYKKKVEGLCGNFDNKKGNDLVKPDGTKAKNVQEFGESWRV